jgi:hypothetical protein
MSISDPEGRAPPTKLCSTCAAFVVSGSADEQHDGWCHFNPPVMIGMAPTAGQTAINPQPFWPEVMNDGWCMQWVAQ